MGESGTRDDGRLSFLYLIVAESRCADELSEVGAQQEVHDDTRKGPYHSRCWRWLVSKYRECLLPDGDIAHIGKGILRGQDCIP